jgi:lipid-binding SYLF domain-containing protein
MTRHALRIGGQAAALIAIASSVLAANAADSKRARHIVETARASLDSFRGDAAYPNVTRALREGIAVVVVPEFIRVGIGIGGEAGTGVLLKKDVQTGKWSAPAFFDLHGASIGPQIGYQKASVLLVVENDLALEAMLRGEVTLGADVGYNAGTAHAHTVASRTGKQVQGIQAFTRGEGIFAGATVKGMIIRTNETLNAAYYDATASSDSILSSPDAAGAGSGELRALLTRMAGADAAGRR